MNAKQANARGSSVASRQNTAAETVSTLPSQGRKRDSNGFSRGRNPKFMVNKLEPLPKAGRTETGHQVLNSLPISPIKGLPITVASLDNESFRGQRRDASHNHVSIKVDEQEGKVGAEFTTNDFQQSLFDKLNEIDPRRHNNDNSSRQSLARDENREKGCSRQSSMHELVFDQQKNRLQIKNQVSPPKTGRGDRQSPRGSNMSVGRYTQAHQDHNLTPDTESHFRKRSHQHSRASLAVRDEQASDDDLSQNVSSAKESVSLFAKPKVSFREKVDHLIQRRSSRASSRRDSGVSQISESSDNQSVKSYASHVRRKRVQDLITTSKLQYNQHLLLKQQAPIQVDIKKLPDYMTYRKQKLKEKKNMKINYTLDLTETLPRPDFRRTKPKIYDINVPDTVEQSLQNQIKILQEQAELKDNPFLSSLKKAQGMGFIGKLKPVLARHQKIYEPTGSSSSRNPLLLRNTFNIEIYNEFIKQKREMRSKFKEEYAAREAEVLRFLDQNDTSSTKVSKRFRDKIDKIKTLKQSKIKRNHLIKLLTDEAHNASKIDQSFFKVLEMDLDTDHQAQVNAALEQFMAKANLAKKSEQIVVKQIFRRKEALENKLFKMKYAKLLKTLSDANNLKFASERTTQPSSIHVENPVDPKIGIPANTYMFESVIRDAFNIDDSDTEDEDEKKDMLTKKEWLQKCMQTFEEKNQVKAGRVAGPSQRKLNKLDCVEQAKIISKKSQIKVAKREDGMMEEEETEGNLIDMMLKRAMNDEHYERLFKQTVKEIRNGRDNYNRSIFADTSYDSMPLDEQLSPSHTASIFSVQSPQLKSQRRLNTVQPFEKLSSPRGRMQSTLVTPFNQTSSILPAPRQRQTSLLNSTNRSNKIASQASGSLQKKDTLLEQSMSVTDYISKMQKAFNMKQNPVFLREATQKIQKVSELQALDYEQNFRDFHSRAEKLISEAPSQAANSSLGIIDPEYVTMGLHAGLDTSKIELASANDSITSEGDVDEQNGPFQLRANDSIVSQKHNPFHQLNEQSQSFTMINKSKKSLAKTNLTQPASPCREAAVHALEPLFMRVQKQIQFKNHILGKLRSSPNRPAHQKSPETLSETEWKHVSRNKALQFAVLEQIRSNCKDLSKQNKSLKPDFVPLVKTGEEIVEMSEKNLQSRIVQRGHSVKPIGEPKATLRVKLDPLNPKKWKNETGTKYRADKNAKEKEMKEDLMIMIDTICTGKSADAFNKLSQQSPQMHSKR